MENYPNIREKENESFDLSNFIEDNLNTYYNNKMDIMNNGIYLSHSLEG